MSNLSALPDEAAIPAAGTTCHGNLCDSFAVVRLIVPRSNIIAQDADLNGTTPRPTAGSHRNGTGHVRDQAQEGESGGAVPFADDQIHQETAERIQRDNPNWFVVWGVYSREFVAFPLFGAPPGTVLYGRNPGELAGRMRETEQFLAAQPRWTGGN